MSLGFFARRLLDRLPRLARRMFSIAPRPDLIPLTFKDVQRRRQQIHGGTTDRAPCGCPACRHARQATITSH
jgi:hypothetical protein